MNDDFDDMLRSRLQHSEPVGPADATQVLNELRPTMRRARIRRSVAVGAATLSFLGAGGIGVAAVATSLGAQQSEVDVFDSGVQLPAPSPTTATAVEHGEEASDDLPTSHEGVNDPPDTSAGAPTSTAPDEPVPADASSTGAPPHTDPSTTQSSTDDDPPATSAPQQPPLVTSPTSIAPPSTPPSTTPATTQVPPTSTTTTTTPTGQWTILSNCGSIGIAYSGSSISLTGTQPAAGFVPDVKNAGPETVEVGLADGAAECEIKAWMDAGVLRLDVDNHDEDDD